MYSMSIYKRIVVILDHKIPPKPGIIGLGNTYLTFSYLKKSFYLSTVRFLNTVLLSVLVPGDWEACGQLVEDGLQGEDREQKDVIRPQTT